MGWVDKPDLIRSKLLCKDLCCASKIPTGFSGEDLFGHLRACTVL